MTLVLLLRSRAGGLRELAHSRSQSRGTLNQSLGVLPAGKRLANERESKWDKRGVTTKFILRTFSISLRGELAAGGDDVLNAEWSLENIYSVNRAILTPIPFGVPHVQTNCGVTISYSRVSGRMTCLNAATATAWARAKIPGGGYTEEGGNREGLA
jgi:hypothetical protein